MKDQLDVTCYFISLLMVSVLQAEAYNMDTIPTQPHRNSNTHRTKNNTTNVVIQQNSRKFLMMAILISETCRAHKKYKIASDVKLVLHSSTTKDWTQLYGGGFAGLRLFCVSGWIDGEHSLIPFLKPPRVIARMECFSFVNFYRPS